MTPHPRPAIKVTFFDPLLGRERAVRAGRMECTMQNLADSLTTRTSAPLPSTAASPPDGGSSSGGGGGGVGGGEETELSSFMVYNMRRKVWPRRGDRV